MPPPGLIIQLAMRLLACILCASVAALAAAAGSRLPLPLRYASRMIREHSNIPPFFRSSSESFSTTSCAEDQPDSDADSDSFVLDVPAPAAAADPLMGTRGGSTRVKKAKGGSMTAAQKRAAAEYKARQQAAKKKSTSSSNNAKRKRASSPATAAPAAAKRKPATSAAASKAKAKESLKKDTNAAAAADAATTTTNSSPGSGLLTTGSTQMPTLFFTPTEADLDRYSACLAAAEGLRRARDAGATSSRVKRALRDIDSGKLDANTSKNKDKDRMMKKWSADERKEFDTLRASYALNTAKMVRSLGLSVARFNQLGKVVGSDPVLKERVMEQAYLYGMAAGLTGMEKVPLITGKRIGSGGGSKGNKGTKLTGSNGSGVGAPPPISSEQINTFARCLSEVEELREGNLEELRQSLQVDYLPPVICDPNVRSLLDPRVRAVCDAFPLQAEEVVQRFGMGSDDFNSLLDRLRSDPIFRFRVKRSMSKL
jgi:hypothetical protein